MFKKTLSAILAICISLGIIFTVFNMSGINLVSAADNSKSEVWFFMGKNKALVRGNRFLMNAEPHPLENGDSAYIPLSAICEYDGSKITLTGNKAEIDRGSKGKITLTMGDKKYLDGSAEKELGVAPKAQDGEVFLSVWGVKAVFGLNEFANYELGNIVFSTSNIGYNYTYNSVKEQVNILNRLFLDRPSQETIYNSIKDGVGLDTHPRLLADQAKFDELRDMYYNAEEVNEFYSVLSLHVGRGITIFNTLFDMEGNNVVWKSTELMQSVRQPYFLYDERGKRLDGYKTYEYTDENGKLVKLEVDGSGYGDGYDVGGRSYAKAQTQKLKDIAMAWQITGEQKYAEAFYLLAKELGKWKHWGEGHFLNCADASAEYAIGLDWIYHAFDSEPEKRAELYKILYDKGLSKGYHSIMADITGDNSHRKFLCESRLMGGGWRILNRTNNWQTVCGSGMIISGLLLCEIPEYKDEALFTVEQLMRSVEKCLMQYVPDGAYIESPGYWVYGTKTLYTGIAAVLSSCGTTFGYNDIIGLRESCYFAFFITDSDFIAWNYHDGGVEQIDRSVYYLASKLHNDPNIAAMRDYMVKERDINPDLLDLLYYDPTLSDGNTLEMLLDYHFKGIDTVTMRSSWDSGANFAGLHAGPNDVPHGDIDCGNFFLEMGGVKWAGDPGSEDYNIPNYFGWRRYYYYRKSAESHNTIVIRNDNDLPLGQVKTTFGANNFARINTLYSDENGSYAVTDMRKTFGNNCVSANRGLLMTNSRNTVVVQDEMKFSKPTDLTWICANPYVYKISEDGRTAYARRYVGNDPVELRMTIVSDNKDLKFEVMAKTTDIILSKTITGLNSNNPNVSNPQKRIVINANGVTDFDVAVVFDLIKHPDEVVGYKKVAMKDWTTTTDEWVKEANKDIDYPENKPSYKYGFGSFMSAINKINKAETLKEKGKIIRDTIKYTTDYDKEDSRVVDACNKYMKLVDDYNKELDRINKFFGGLFFDLIPDQKGTWHK